MSTKTGWISMTGCIRRSAFASGPGKSTRRESLGEAAFRLQPGRLGERLVDDAVALRETNQGLHLLGSGIGVDVEDEPNRLETDVHFLADAHRAAKIEVSLCAN